MGYLQASEYTLYGLTAETRDDLVTTASALIDAYCKRTTLLTAQYTERLRVTAGARTVRLSTLPLVAVAPATTPLVSVRARLGGPRRGELPQTMAEEIGLAFSLPGSWTALDASAVDAFCETGELALAQNVLGLPYNEVEVTYTAGLEEIPDAVKTACALIVKNMQTTPGCNVKSSRMDTMQMEYFSGSLMDEQVKLLLRPYVSQRMG
ncbi:MAG: hypothetical protein P4L10_10760 [Acidobacteriaceae bacterium]|jgi:hypothetical protein|nr:hypothetical protein [Acidobacteriaceae bacterium]